MLIKKEGFEHRGVKLGQRVKLKGYEGIYRVIGFDLDNFTDTFTIINYKDDRGAKPLNISLHLNDYIKDSVVLEGYTESNYSWVNLEDIEVVQDDYVSKEAITSSGKLREIGENVIHFTRLDDMSEIEDTVLISTLESRGYFIKKKVSFENIMSELRKEIKENGGYKSNTNKYKLFYYESHKLICIRKSSFEDNLLPCYFTEEEAKEIQTKYNNMLKENGWT